MGRPGSVDESFDVLVAGGGGSGLMAALTAAEQGATVLLVEKHATLGGATGMAIGSISASGTALQAAAGIEDDADAHFDDLLKFIPPARSPQDYDLDLSRLMIEWAPKAISRLSGLGVEFSGPHPEPPHRVNRMHNVVPNTGAYIDALSSAARRRGVAVRTETIIRQLERDGTGAIVGAVLSDPGTGRPRKVQVRRGVVLAAGDAGTNYAVESGLSHGVEPTEQRPSHAGADSITLARSVGAAVARMQPGAPHFRSVGKPYTNHGGHLFHAGAILVNSGGRRFTNELAEPALATLEQPGSIAFIVFDSRLAGRIATAEEDSAGARDGWHHRGKLYLSTFTGIGYAYLDDYRQRTPYFAEADSLRGLAQRIQVPVSEFKEDVARFNRAAAGDDGGDAFGREPPGSGISEPPFYAIGPIISGTAPPSAGLMVDRRLQVLDEAGQKIPHLYAAGVNGQGNAFLGGHGHHLAWAFGSGMIAGTNVAR